MKILIVSLVALVVAVTVVLSGMQDPGVIVLNWSDYRVRLPLLLFVILIVFGFLLLYLLISFVGGMLNAPKKYRVWYKQHSQSVAHKHTMLGYAGLIEGDWQKAEKELQVKIEYNNTPLLNYLGAAYAAQQQGNYKQRDYYLDKALKKFPKHQFSIDLTRARLLLRNGEYVGAKEYLQELVDQKPQNLPALRLLADTYEYSEDWTGLVKLIPSLKKNKAFADDQIKYKQYLSYEKLLSNQALLTQDGEKTVFWKSLPRKVRKDANFIAIYANSLITQGQDKEAEEIIRAALQKGYNKELVSIYRRVNSSYLDYQIKLLKKFLPQHEQSVELYHALAKFYQYQTEYEQAVSFYEQALQCDSDDGSLYNDYALLLEQLGQESRALFYFKKGANVSDGKELPQPEVKQIVALSDDRVFEGELVMPNKPSSNN